MRHHYLGCRFPALSWMLHEDSVLRWKPLKFGGILSGRLRPPCELAYLIKVTSCTQTGVPTTAYVDLSPFFFLCERSHHESHQHQPLGGKLMYGEKMQVEIRA